MKGLQSFNPLAFTHVLPDVTNSKLYEDLMFGKLCLALYLQNLWFTLVMKLVTFGYVVGVFLPRKFKLILRIFALVSRRK